MLSKRRGYTLPLRWVVGVGSLSLNARGTSAQLRLLARVLGSDGSPIVMVSTE